MRMTDISPKIERAVAVLDEDRTILDAAQLMVERYIGSIVVTAAHDVVGIFTERDLMRIVAQRRDPAGIKLKEVMRVDLLRVSPYATVEDCLSLMRANRCRHLLVFDGEDFLGIVSLRDLAMLMLDEKEHLIAELTTYITG
jgi:CBS domain-containing protein